MIPCKMVLKRKLDDQGQVSREKAKIVVKGFFQKKEIYYFETFVPVVPFNIVLLFVGKFISEGCDGHYAGI